MVERSQIFRMTIYIELCRSVWKDDAWNIRIGDISGSEETSNISRDEVISFIKEKMIIEKDNKDIENGNK